MLLTAFVELVAGIATLVLLLLSIVVMGLALTWDIPNGIARPMLFLGGVVMLALPVQLFRK